MYISDRSFYAKMDVCGSSRSRINISSLPFVALVSQPTPLPLKTKPKPPAKIKRIWNANAFLCQTPKNMTNRHFSCTERSPSAPNWHFPKSRLAKDLPKLVVQFQRVEGLDGIKHGQKNRMDWPPESDPQLSVTCPLESHRILTGNLPVSTAVLSSA